MFDHDTPRRRLAKRTLAFAFLSLLPSPVSAALAMSCLVRRGRCVVGTGRAVETFSAIASLSVAITATMVVSSLIWSAAAESFSLLSRPHALPLAMQLRQLLREAACFSVELLTAFSLSELMRCKAAKNSETLSLFGELVASNALRASLYTSFIATKPMIYLVLDLASENRLRFFQSIGFLLLATLYEAADQALGAVRFFGEIIDFPDYAIERTIDFVSAGMTDAFVWKPVLGIWAAVLTIADVSRRIVRHAARSLAE